MHAQQLTVDANGNLVGTFTVNSPPEDIATKLQDITTIPVKFIVPNENQANATLPPGTDTTAPTVIIGACGPPPAFVPLTPRPFPRWRSVDGTGLTLPQRSHPEQPDFRLLQSLPFRIPSGLPVQLLRCCPPAGFG